MTNRASFVDCSWTGLGYRRPASVGTRRNALGANALRSRARSAELPPGGSEDARTCRGTVGERDSGCVSGELGACGVGSGVCLANQGVVLVVVQLQRVPQPEVGE